LIFNFNSLNFKPSVRPKVLGAKPKQAGKKEGGWGEGIFARLLPFPFYLSKRKVEEEGWGKFRFSLVRNQNGASPAALLVESRTPQKSFLFLLGEKIRRAHIRKGEENFFAGWRALASGGEAER